MSGKIRRCHVVCYMEDKESLENCLNVTTIAGRSSMEYVVQSVKCAYNQDTKTARIYMETERMPESTMERYLESCGAKSVVIDSLAVEDWEAASVAALRSVIECSKAAGVLLMEFGKEPRAGLGLESGAGEERHEVKKRVQSEELCSSFESGGGSGKFMKTNEYGCGSQQELELVLARSMVDATKQASAASGEKNKLELQLVRFECDWKMEKADYERKIKRLTKKVSVLQTENEQLQSCQLDAGCSQKVIGDLDRVNGEKTELCARLEYANGEVDALKSMNNDLSMQLNAKNGELEVVQSVNKDLVLQLNGAKSEVDRLRTSCTDIGTRFDRVNEEVSVLRSTNANVQSEVDLLKSENSVLRGEIQKFNDERVQLTVDRNTFEADRLKYNHEVALMWAQSKRNDRLTAKPHWLVMFEAIAPMSGFRNFPEYQLQQRVRLGHRWVAVLNISKSTEKRRMDVFIALANAREDGYISKGWVESSGDKPADELVLLDYILVVSQMHKPSDGRRIVELAKGKSSDAIVCNVRGEHVGFEYACGAV